MTGTRERDNRIWKNSVITSICEGDSKLAPTGALLLLDAVTQENAA